MKAKAISSLSVAWWPRLISAGEEFAVDDHRESLCRDVRRLAEKGLVTILVEQQSPHAPSKSEVHP